MFIYGYFYAVEFFKKKNVSVLTVKELFDFVTDATITEDNIDLYLEKAMTLASQRTTDDITEQQKVDEEVRFLRQSHDILNVTRKHNSRFLRQSHDILNVTGKQ